MKTKIKTYKLIETPQVMLHDSMSFFRVEHDDSFKKSERLEDYFNDIYHIFLNKLVKITHQSVFEGKDQEKLKSLFEELIRIKSLLQNSEEK